MYKHFVRPILFKFNAETAHHITISSLKLLRYIPFAKYILKRLFTLDDKKLRKDILGMVFNNPIGLAAGLDKDAECFDMLSHMGFGFIEIGTLTPIGQPGNPKPRLFRIIPDQAIINRMGFNNKGVNNAIKNIKRLRKSCLKGTVIGGNIGKNSSTSNEDAPKDYLEVFKSLYDYLDYFTINVSCPNVKDLCGLQNRESVSNIIKDIVDYRELQIIRKPIFLKISSDLEYNQIDMMVDVASEYNIDGIVAVNTTTKRHMLDSLTNSEIEAIGRGGMSGKPLTERAVSIVKHISEYTGGNMPIIGVGGIMTPEDGARMIEAGASLIQIYSGFIYNGPSFPKAICKEISQRL